MNNQLVDRFGRTVNYLRMSVTDRCDLRCVYCMAEKTRFLPRDQILSLEECAQIAEGFISLGVKKIRLTGGEPLIRHNVIALIERLGANPDLQELVLTTNGNHLKKYAVDLQRAGIKRINISLDTLRAERFKTITRNGELDKVLDGIEATCAAGFRRIKLNSVILKDRNYDEILDLARFAIERDIDITFIEEMPLGEIRSHERKSTYCSSDEVRDILQREIDLVDDIQSAIPTTSGPSRYYRVASGNSRIGFISPHSHNFCEHCNRVRLTVGGRLLLCLGNENYVDFKAIVRRHPNEPEALRQAILDAIAIKPERHWFDHDDKPDIVRFMNTTGG